MNANTKNMPRLTRGQGLVLAGATLPMIAVGVAGGVGTYTNVAAEFGRGATAIGVVAAGEGVTLVLALVMVGLTMLGQSAPSPIRLGLWGAPVVAACAGLSVADNTTEMVVYGMTPMAMSASAEGLGLLARRIVVHRTGVDMEVQRRNAVTVQQLAYHRARAVNHPSDWARKRSARASWRLARQVGVGDQQLGANLVSVQRERLTEGADAALADMLTTPSQPALPPADEDVQEPEEERTLGELLDDIGWYAPGSFAAARVAGQADELPQPARRAATHHGEWDAKVRGILAEQFPEWDIERKPVQPSLEAADDVPEVTTERVDVAPKQVVTEVPAWTTVGPYWEGAPVLDPKPLALPAEQPRQVVTEKVLATPSELRRKARSMHRQVVADGGRGVTIEHLRTELGLSRRDAAELRREVVGGVES